MGRASEEKGCCEVVGHFPNPVSPTPTDVQAFFSLYDCFVSMACVCTCVSGTLRGQKGVSDPLELARCHGDAEI